MKPIRKGHVLGIQVDQEMFDRLRAAASAEDRTVSGYVRRVVKAALADRESAGAAVVEDARPG